MNTHPVRVGSCLFTMVDPVRGHEVDYNRWYERDHFYAGCMVGPWLFAGRRWVATRDLKDLRFPAESPLAVPVDAGSYLAIYWVHEGRHDEHFAWSIDQVVGLYRSGRGFEHRVHAHTALLHEPRFHYRDDDPVPVELALDHPYRGLAVVAVDPTGAAGPPDASSPDAGPPAASSPDASSPDASSPAASSPDADSAEPAGPPAADGLDAYLRAEALPGLMDGSAVASMVSWRYVAPASGATDRAPMDLGTPPGPPERRVQLFFLEDDPAEVWPRFRDYGAGLAAAGRGEVVFAAGFRPTVVGTDTYTDRLW